MLIKSKKIILSFLLSSTLISNAFAANTTAVSLSRANCWAPFPNFMTGTGYHSESLTYDRLFRNHILQTTTTQQLKPNNKDWYAAYETILTRILNSSWNYQTTWRSYAGYTDQGNYAAVGQFWYVQGTHSEKLSTFSYLNSKTTATNCNITTW